MPHPLDLLCICRPFEVEAIMFLRLPIALTSRANVDSSARQLSPLYITHMQWQHAGWASPLHTCCGRGII